MVRRSGSGVEHRTLDRKVVASNSGRVSHFDSPTGRVQMSALRLLFETPDFCGDWDNNDPKSALRLLFETPDFCGDRDNNDPKSALTVYWGALYTGVGWKVLSLTTKLNWNGFLCYLFFNIYPSAVHTLISVVLQHLGGCCIEGFIILVLKCPHQHLWRHHRLEYAFQSFLSSF